MLFEKFEPGEAAVAAARRLYDDGAKWTRVAEALAASESTARKYAKLWGWPERASPERPPPPRRKPQKPAEETRDTAALARRVETAVRHELCAIEKRLGSSTTASAERNARVLASLVKSLAELRKLDREETQARNPGNEGEQDDGPRPPRDLARLRDEFAADLERMRAEEEAARESRES